MKTDNLIDVLSTNLEPVESGRLGRTLVWAVIAGAVAAFLVMLTTVALRTDVGSVTHLPFLAVKVLFGSSLTAAGVVFLIRSMYPGRDARHQSLLLSLPFVGLAVGALSVLVVQSPAAWSNLVLGTHWALCLLCVPLFAVIPFLILIAALRRGAPTNLTRTGAVAGLVAGSLGAVAYAFHCPDDSLPFIAIWYSAPIALCALIGSKLGPRLLRW